MQMSVLLMYLSKLFIQVRRVDLSALSQLFIEHVLVPGDEIGAQEFLHLHRHVHGHRDDVIKQDHEGQEVCECSDHLKQGGRKTTAMKF